MKKEDGIVVCHLKVCVPGELYCGSLEWQG